MDLEEILKFAKEEHRRLSDHYNFTDRTEQIMPNMLKVIEEVGELSEEILKQNKLQRKEKLAKVTSGVENELADVIITVLILAESLDIDAKKALEDKIEQISKYWANE